MVNASSNKLNSLTKHKLPKFNYTMQRVACIFLCKYWLCERKESIIDKQRKGSHRLRLCKILWIQCFWFPDGQRESNTIPIQIQNSKILVVRYILEYVNSRRKCFIKLINSRVLLWKNRAKNGQNVYFSAIHA